MAELNLTIYNVDNLEEIEQERRQLEEEERLKEKQMPIAEKTKTKTKTKTSWRDWLGVGSRDKQCEPHARPRSPLRGEMSVFNAKVAAVFKDYLQPTTALTEDEAFQSIVTLIPSNDQYGRQVRSVSQMVVELAEQIPFDHPSSFRLAELTCRLGKTPKFTRDCVDYFNVCQLLGEFLHDEQTGNDRAYRNVNIVAFHAKLCACGLWFNPENAANLLRYVFEDDRDRHDDDSVYKSGHVMEGAVWILFYGHVVYQVVLQDNEADRWAVWRAGFASMETESFATDECKKLSARAVKMMDALAYV